MFRVSVTRLPATPTPGRELRKLIRYIPGASASGRQAILSVTRTGHDLAQLTQQTNGTLAAPEAIDRIERHKGPSTLHVVDREYFDPYHRAGTGDWLINHDILLSAPLYDALLSLMSKSASSNQEERTHLVLPGIAADSLTADQDYSGPTLRQKIAITALRLERFRGNRMVACHQLRQRF